MFRYIILNNNRMVYELLKEEDGVTFEPRKKKKTTI